MGDYVRQLPHHGSRDMAKRPSVIMRFHIDVPLLLLLLLLTLSGLLVLYSASGQSMEAVYRQGRYIALAYVIMIVAAQINVQSYARWAPWFYLLGIALLVAVILVGDGAKGAQRWLKIRQFSLPAVGDHEAGGAVGNRRISGGAGPATALLPCYRRADSAGLARRIGRDSA